MLIIGRLRYLLKIYLPYFWRKGVTFSMRGYIESDVKVKICKNSIFRSEYFEALYGTRIIVEKNGILSLGNGVFFNRFCSINVKDKVTIGAGTLFGESVKIYDHDHRYKLGLKNTEFDAAEIYIGEKCWFGSNVVVLKNSTVGDGAVVGAGVIVHTSIEDGMLVYNQQNLKSKKI